MDKVTSQSLQNGDVMDRWTDGQTNGQRDGQSDKQGSTHMLWQSWRSKCNIK